MLNRYAVFYCCKGVPMRLVESFSSEMQAAHFADSHSQYFALDLETLDGIEAPSRARVVYKKYKYKE